MSNLPTLYEIAGDLRRLLDLMNDPSVSADDLLQAVEQVSSTFQEKAVNVTAVLRSMESLARQIREAEKDMEIRRRSIEWKSEWLRSYLLENMEQCGISQIDHPRFRIAIRKNPPSVEILDPDSIPDEYLRERVISEPDKQELLRALKQGQEVPGAVLVQKKRLEIR